MITDEPKGSYSLVAVGSGFGTLFAVEAYRRHRPGDRVLILERGPYRSRTWQLEQGRNAEVDASAFHRTRPGEKPWNYTVGFGGGLNCWWAQTPRFHPSDLRTRTLYDRGSDWPVSYDDLEPYYLLAEQRLGIAGDDDIGRIIPRSGPFPQPPHRLSSVDELMRAAQPDAHFALPTARASQPTDQRSACCAANRCNLCPTNARFTTDTGFAELLSDDGIDIVLDAEVRTIESTGDSATGVTYRTGGTEVTVAADLVVLGANAIQSPAILLRSAIDDPWVGRGLHEQHSVGYEAYLDGVDNFDGGTVTTAINYALYDGPFRRSAGGALLYFENRWSYGLRPEPGRWRETLPIWVSVEDEPQWDNRVVLDSDTPLIEHADVSDYAKAGVARAAQRLPEVLAPLPVEQLIDRGGFATASHIQGTLRMGQSSDDSVVDGDLLHHRIRNLMVVGSAVLPTSSMANPSLTAAALSLRAMDQVVA